MDINSYITGLMGQNLSGRLLGGSQSGIGQFFNQAGDAGSLATAQPQQPARFSAPQPRPSNDPAQTWEPGGQYPQGMPQVPMPGMAGAAHVRKPGFFGHGGTGWGILGILGDAAAASSGGPARFTEGLMRQREQEQQSQLEDRRYQREQQDKRGHQQAINLGDGGVATYSEDGGLNIVRDPTPQQGEQERLLEMWSKLPDADPRKNMLGTMLRGANLRPEIYQPMMAARTQAQIAAKSAPTYAATHPKPGAGGGGQAQYRIGPNGQLQRRAQ